MEDGGCIFALIRWRRFQGKVWESAGVRRSQRRAREAIAVGEGRRAWDVGWRCAATRTRAPLKTSEAPYFWTRVLVRSAADDEDRGGF